MDQDKTVRQLKALREWSQPTLPFKPGEIKPSPVKKPFVYDTKEGIDFFTKTLKEEANHKLSPKENSDIDKLNRDMKSSVLKQHIKTLQPFDSLNRETYPSRPEVRGKLLEMDKLEKDLEPPKRDHFKHFAKTGKFLEPTKEEIQRSKLPSTWDVIYQSMTPIEKGQWNREQRAKGMNGKTGDPITKTIPKEVNQIMNNELDNIRRMRRDAETLRQMRRDAERPERKFEMKKEEPAGLHETFVKDKLLEGSILKQIREDNEKI
tara:strand:- start:304 stop:1092 length:789 start_codon:yes stop_codon:yes gene_type:complete